MKRITLSIIITCISLIYFQVPVNAEITLIRNGISKYNIQLHTKAGPVERHAAQELAAYLERISGARLEIIFNDRLQSPVIALGKILAGQSKAMMPLREIKWDGFCMVADGRNLFLAGDHPRGTLYAVYDLLETLGCRWFAPNFDFYKPYSGEYIPEMRTVLVGNPDVVKNPLMKHRSKDAAGGGSHTSENMVQIFDWLVKQKLNTWCYPINHSQLGDAVWDEHRDRLIPEAEKRGLLLEIGGHGWQLFLRQDKYFSIHPDWFATIDGEYTDIPRYVFNTTNAAARDALAEEIIKYLDRHPEIDIFDCWPPDGARWSDDPESLRQGTPQQRHGVVINHIAEKVHEKYPDLVLEFLAYADYIYPPEGIRFSENLRCDFAPIRRSYKYPIWSPANERNRTYYDALHQWLAPGVLQGDLTIYTYYRKYAWWSQNVALPRMMTEEIRLYHDMGADGIRMYGEPDDWFTYELNHYVHAKLVWNPNLQLDTLLKDYYRNRYGSAQEVIHAYFDLVERTFPKFLSIPKTIVQSLEELEGYEIDIRKGGRMLEQALISAGNDERVKGLIERLKILHHYAELDYEMSRQSMMMGAGSQVHHRVKPHELMKLYIEKRNLFMGNQGRGLFLNWYEPYPALNIE